ncbi:hypothetical protein V7S43_005048 [Phytophthora oleae]|uniref:Uncharacterized protein n=1 Tax=Phytophthora oleae TaxID=2107226 RepID=A0ABD3FVF0_9STRA
MDPRHGVLRLKEFLQTVSTCDDLHRQENAVLREQVHDLTELLAAFNLCEIEDAHLEAVRDRAFRRDIAPESELLEVYQLERQLQQQALLSALNEERGASSGRRKESEQLESVASASKRDFEALQRRVGGLEQNVANLRLRHDLLLETAPRLKTPTVEEKPGHVNPPSPSGGNETDSHHRPEVSNPDEHAVIELATENMVNTIQEQKQRIVELEEALALEEGKNAKLAQQCHRFEKVEKILIEFNRRC